MTPNALKKPAQAIQMLLTATCALILAAAFPARGGTPVNELGKLTAPTRIEQLGAHIELDMGRTEVIQVPWEVMQVQVGSPEVADVYVMEGNQIVLVAVGLGVTDFIVWNEQGEIWKTEVNVVLELDDLARELSALFPDRPLSVTRVRDVYTVQGTLSSTDQVAAMQAFFEARGIKYLNLTRLEGLQQVQIKVRVAEVNRNAVKNMSVNSFMTGGSFFGAATVGSSNSGPLVPVNIGVPEGASTDTSIPFAFLNSVGTNPLVSLLAGFPNSDLEFFLQALAENQYLRILAEPTLVALSGEEATFLAGGEFPIPVVQGGGDTSTSITIEYKEFGVRLRFLPTVLGNGIIRLNVAPEVSSLSEVGSIQIDGFQIPAVLTRRSETTLEMGSGQTFAMAGLLNQTSNSRDSRIPLLGDLPILGSLFRSMSYQTGESELVVLVTARLVEPVSIDERTALPGELHTSPNHWEFFLGGKIEGALKESAFEEGPRLNIDGLNRLRGPGAWARYSQN